MPAGATRQGGHGIDFDDEDEDGRDGPSGGAAAAAPDMRSARGSVLASGPSMHSSAYNPHSPLPPQPSYTDMPGMTASQQQLYDQGYQGPMSYSAADNPYAYSAAPMGAGMAYALPHGQASAAAPVHDYLSAGDAPMQDRSQSTEWLAPHSSDGHGGPQPHAGSVSSPGASTTASPGSVAPSSDNQSGLERSGTLVQNEEPHRPLGIANA